jgi:hypothetical protein
MRRSITVFSPSFSARVSYRLPHDLSQQMTMEARVQWYHENANGCASRAQQSLNPFARVAYRELTCAWLLLLASAKQLAR